MVRANHRHYNSQLLLAEDGTVYWWWLGVMRRYCSVHLVSIPVSSTVCLLLLRHLFQYNSTEDAVSVQNLSNS